MNTCPYGVTQDELQSILGPRLEDFSKWMVGQTGSICDGRRYVYARAHNAACPHDDGDVYTWECDYIEGGHYEDTECAGNPHGLLIYRSDLERYLRGRPVIDW